MKLSIIPILLFSAILLIPTSAFAVTTTDVMYSCDSPSQSFPPNVFETNKIHTTSKVTFAEDISNSMVVDTPNGSLGCTGLAQDPISGDFYAVIRDTLGDSTGGYLATIDPTTGIGSSIGLINAGIQGIAFDINGDLFGLPNANDDNFDALYQINTSTGLATVLCITPLDGGAGSIGYNWLTDELTILNSDTGTEKLYVIDDTAPATCTITEKILPQTYATHNPQALTFHTGDNSWYTSRQEQGLGTSMLTTILPDSPFTEALISDPADIWKRGIAFLLNLTPSDTEAPNVTGSVININVGSATERTVIDQYVELCTATDNVDPNPICEVKTGGIDTSVVGMQTVNYNSTDVAGNEGIGLIFTTIVDTTFPELTSQSQPIEVYQNTLVDELDFIDCTDTLVEDITNVVTTDTTVDTSSKGKQTITYSCEDVGSNETLLEVEFFVKKKSTGGSSSSSVGGVTTSTVPKLSDIPILSFSDSSSQQTDKGTNISDLFANLFDNRITEGITTPTQSQGSSPLGGSSDTTQRPNPITDFLQNLFANFFN